MRYHMPEEQGSLTEIVENWRAGPRDVMALPHPSPRNNIWLKKHPWFEQDVLPVLRQRVQAALS